MKLKFLEDINEYDEHAIRLNDFDKAEAVMFLQLLKDITSGNCNLVELTDYDFIEAINCELILRVSESDEGITTEDNKLFVCDLTRESYADMIILIRPFCLKETDAYQYLYELDNPIDFLFSAGKEN